MGEYDELASRAERGEILSVHGTARRGAAAAAEGQRALRDATEQRTIEGATRVALGRPRLGSEGASPVWRVRASVNLDARVRALAAQKKVPLSQVVRDAVAAYVDAG